MTSRLLTAPVWYERALFQMRTATSVFILSCTLPFQIYTQSSQLHCLQNQLFQKQQNRLNFYWLVSFAPQIPPLPFHATILLPRVRHHILYLFKTYRAQTVQYIHADWPADHDQDMSQLSSSCLSISGHTNMDLLVCIVTGFMNVYRFTNIKNFIPQTSDQNLTICSS